MARRLTAYVHVHQDDGTVNVYGPGDSVPAADAKRIVNPKAWEGEDESEDESKPAPVKRAAIKA